MFEYYKKKYFKKITKKYILFHYIIKSVYRGKTDYRLQTRKTHQIFKSYYALR